MTRHILTLALVAVSTSVSADTVSFQSGEHGSFTRIVATLPTQDTNWQVSSTGRTYTLTIQGEDFQFDTDSIFTRISRSRLASVETDPSSGEAKLNLACDCVIESERFGDRHVILDIRERTSDDPAEAPSNFTLRLQDIQPKEPLRYGLSQGTAVPARPEASAPEAEPSAEEPQADPIAMLGSHAHDREKVSRIAQQVIKQINRAKEQNLLDGVDRAEPPATEVELDNGSNWKMSDHKDTIEKAQNNTLNVSTYNAMDVASQEISALLAGRNGPPACIDDALLDIESWGGQAPFAVELGQLRSNLVGEFDRTNSDALTKLAQFYIAHTFGAEARQILRTLPEAEQNSVLWAMSELVESGKVSAGNPFIEQDRCDSDVVFWAALSGQTLANQDALDRAFETLIGLPIPLREHLAPYLSNRLVEQGHFESAAQVLHAVERINPTQSPEFEMAQAALHSELGDDEAAMVTLEKVASANSSVAPSALVALINTLAAQDAAVPADTIALVGALSVEHKAGALGPDLRHAHAQARMQALDFVAAFHVVQEISELDGPQAAKRTRSEVARALMAHGDDFDVLRIAISEGLTEPNVLEAATAFALAEKMYDLGFLDQTKRVLQAMDIDHVTPELHLLKAKVALAEGLPRRAEAELLNVDAPSAAALRAEARSMAGDHEAASEILEAMGKPERAAFEAWLAGDISGLSGLEIEVYQRIESMMATAGVQASEVSTQSGVLRRNRNLLTGSEDARETLEELLQIHQVSDPSS